MNVCMRDLVDTVIRKEAIDDNQEKLITKIIEISINDFDERTANMIKMRYEKNLTLEKTGIEYGLSRNRVLQIIQRAIRKIRSHYRVLINAVLNIKTYPEDIQMAITRYIMDYGNERVSLVNLIAGNNIDGHNRVGYIILCNQLIRTILISTHVPLYAIFRDLSESYVPSCSVTLNTRISWMNIDEDIYDYIMTYHPHFTLKNLIDLINEDMNSTMRRFSHVRTEKILKIINDAGYGHLIQHNEV